MSIFQEEAEDYFGKKVVKIGAIILVVLLIYTGISAIFHIFPFNLVQKTVNAESIIMNYEWFYDQYNAIEAQKANIDSMPADASERPGMLMVLNNSVAEYNAKSRMINRILWKAKDLPYQISFGGNK